MGKSIFQKAADWIRGIKTPDWLRDLLQEIQDVFVAFCIQIGKDYLTDLKNKIIEVSNTDLSNEDKFQAVFNYARDRFIGINIKDSALQLIIQYLVVKLKQQGLI